MTGNNLILHKALCLRISAENGEKQQNKACEEELARLDMDEILIYKAMIKMDEIRQHALSVLNFECNVHNTRQDKLMVC